MLITGTRGDAGNAVAGADRIAGQPSRPSILRVIFDHHSPFGLYSAPIRVLLMTSAELLLRKQIEAAIRAWTRRIRSLPVTTAPELLPHWAGLWLEGLTR